MASNLFTFYIFIILSTAAAAGLLYIGIRVVRRSFHIEFRYNRVIGIFLLFLSFRSFSLNILFYLKEIIAFDLYSFLLFHSVSQDILTAIITSVPLIAESMRSGKNRLRIYVLTVIPAGQLAVRFVAYFLLLPHSLMNLFDIFSLAAVTAWLIYFTVTESALRSPALLSGALILIFSAGYAWGETGLIIQSGIVRIGLTVFFALNILEAGLLLKFFPRRQIDEVDESLLEECGITGREREMILWAVRGYTNSEIAEQLSLSEKTIKNHFTSIYDKIGVKNRIDLFRLAAKT